MHNSGKQQYLYTAQASRELDQIAIEDFQLPGYSLMSRAGQAVFELLQQHYPLAKRILVCCGTGNNAGDGYVIARLAQKAGLEVDVVSLVDPDSLRGDAQQAYGDWKSLGIQLKSFTPSLVVKADVVIDALLGTGLERDVSGAWYELIEQMNQLAEAVVAVDVPSGLNADTGSVMGIAVKATMTLSFIALKKGMYTHQAADYCGELHFNDLALPAGVYQQVPATARLLDESDISSSLIPRQSNSHKGSFGHVLVIGGDQGTAGAVRMTAEAALRSGAGLVSVLTRSQNVSAIVSARPEIMVSAADDGVIPVNLIQRATVIVIGPGLGRSDWGNRLLGQVLDCKQPKLIDADALYLLAKEPLSREDWVLTPHPGEAAQLLGLTSADIQQDRFAAIETLQQQFGGTIVLKGAGTLIQSSDQLASVCPYGNPGMATAGMGDVLTGIIAALMAQGLPQHQAAEIGVLVHARAGDQAALKGKRGLIATDLFDSIRQFVNPELSI